MPERILVIDDEVDMLMLLRMIIEDNTGYAVETTNNASEALKMLRETSYHLVVTDLKMPGIDGLELFREIRQIDPRLPVIIITAYASEASAEEAARLGAANFITKPFRKNSILFAIEKALELVRVKQENEALKERLDG